MKKITILLILLIPAILFAQYNNFPIKEEYDTYSEKISNTTSNNVCTLPPLNDIDIISDMSKLLEGYIELYRTTKDKAYLYKFMKKALCIMENRHDYAFAPIFPPRWTWSSPDPGGMYLEGNVLAALSHFVYLIRVENSNSLYYEQVYQFDELKPSNYVSNTCGCNKFGISFITFGQFANWLQDRVGETAYWYINNDYWSWLYGMKKLPNDNLPADINMQQGFARMFLFNGLSAGNNDFLGRAMLIAQKAKGNVVFSDDCNHINYNKPVFINNPTTNAYYWYHRGGGLNLIIAFGMVVN